MTGPYSISYSFGKQGINFSDRPPYRGLFINLDRSVDRRTRMEAQLKKFNLQDRYSRFSAVDGRALTGLPKAITASEHACFQSHCRALESVKLNSWDGPYSGRRCNFFTTDGASHQLVSNSSGLFDFFDMIFTHTFVGLEPLLLRKFKQLFDLSHRSKPPEFTVIDVKNDYRGLSGSYLVPTKAIDKVLSVLCRGFDTGPNLPIDIFMRQEAQIGRLRLGCIFPFITSGQINDIGTTTITDRGKDTEISREITSLLQYSFFIGRDLKNIPPALLNRLHAVNDDDHHKLITAVLGFAHLRPAIFMFFDFQLAVARKQTLISGSCTSALSYGDTLLFPQIKFPCYVCSWPASPALSRPVCRIMSRSVATGG